MADKSRYTLRVDADKLDGWRDAVDDGEEYSSLRHLISLAVTRELSDNYVLRDDIEGLDVEVSESVGNSIEELRTDIAGLQQTVENIEVHQSEDPGDLADFTSQIYEYIPQVPRNREDAWLGISVQNTGQISIEEAVGAYGRLRDIARLLGEDEKRIRAAATKLQRDLPDVHTELDAAGNRRVYELTEEEELHIPEIDIDGLEGEDDDTE